MPNVNLGNAAPIEVHNPNSTSQIELFRRVGSLAFFLLPKALRSVSNKFGDRDRCGIMLGRKFAGYILMDTTSHKVFLSSNVHFCNESETYGKLLNGIKHLDVSGIYNANFNEDMVEESTDLPLILNVGRSPAVETTTSTDEEEDTMEEESLAPPSSGTINVPAISSGIRPPSTRIRKPTSRLIAKVNTMSINTMSISSI